MEVSLSSFHPEEFISRLFSPHKQITTILSNMFIYEKVTLEHVRNLKVKGIPVPVMSNMVLICGKWFGIEPSDMTLVDNFQERVVSRKGMTPMMTSS